MNNTRRTGTVNLVLVYLSFALAAKGQVFDPTSEISNQVDNSVTEHITTETIAASSNQEAATPTAPPSPAASAANNEKLYKIIKSLRSSLTQVEISNNVDQTPRVVSEIEQQEQKAPGTVVVVPGESFPANIDVPYSGYGEEKKDWSYKKVIAFGSFVNRNSYLGKGVTDTENGQLGWSFDGPAGTSIQPFLTYQSGSTDLSGNNTGNSTNYGFALSMAQKIFPAVAVFKDHQPKATYNLTSTVNDPACPKDPNSIPDHFPNCDVQALLNLSYGDGNISTLGKNWAYSTQNTFAIAPGFSFDLFPRRPSEFSLLPVGISILPSWTYLFTEDQNNNRASSGLLSISDRNTYQWSLNHWDDCDQTPRNSISLIESNTLLHDTNEDLLTPQSGRIAYQNWVRFGLALQWTYQPNPETRAGEEKSKYPSVPSARIEYDYDAFNNQYQQHTVMLTINLTFP
jgi:hypothetical protein